MRECGVDSGTITPSWYELKCEDSDGELKWEIYLQLRSCCFTFVGGKFVVHQVLVKGSELVSYKTRWHMSSYTLSYARLVTN